MLEYLKGVGPSIKDNETPGLDCAVVKTKFPGIVRLVFSVEV